MLKLPDTLLRGIKGLFSLLLGAGALASPSSATPTPAPPSIESRVLAVRTAVNREQLPPDQQPQADVAVEPVAQWGNWGNWNNWGNWVNWNNWNNWGNWGNWPNF